MVYGLRRELSSLWSDINCESQYDNIYTVGLLKSLLTNHWFNKMVNN